MALLSPALLAQGLVLAVLLAAIAVVDARHMIIPDALNLALALTGIAFHLPNGFVAVSGQLACAVLVFALIYGIRYAHGRMTGRIGLGLGDVKMMSAAACWIGPMLLPMLLFIASAAALVVVGCQAVAGFTTDRNRRIPFGPFIALGLACTWAYEQFSAIEIGS
ncbi:prepilin peptidase [Mesorhizobium sp. UC22_110]|uniref:prepilin peptidase n=1 Tax=unclassified Mesorhizobium TaxID=325217 RepID=UPI00366D4F42